MEKEICMECGTKEDIRIVYLKLETFNILAEHPEWTRPERYTKGDLTRFRFEMCGKCYDRVISSFIHYGKDIENRLAFLHPINGVVSSEAT